MGFLQKWFGKKESNHQEETQASTQTLPEPQPTNQPCGCQTDELIGFIGEFVKEEQLQSAIKNLADKQQDECGCGCGCDDSPKHDTPEHSGSEREMSKIQASVPQLEVLLAGHKAWCAQLEQIMRDGKASEYNMKQVGSELMCCIGQWLKCEGKALADYQEYTDLLKDYERFQECAGVMLENHQKGYLIDAIQMLRGDFAMQSERVQTGLQSLVNKIRSEMEADND